MGLAPRHSSMASSSTTSWPYFMPMAAHIERSSRCTVSAYSRTRRTSASLERSSYRKSGSNGPL